MDEGAYREEDGTSKRNNSFQAYNGRDIHGLE
jgi:hypothetical protein